MSAPLLEARSLCKGFPGVQALQEVAFAVYAGEVVALIGENGAGKSTLMKILAGVHRPDAGTLHLHGDSVAFSSPLAAQQRGIALIRQELEMCDNLTAAAVLFLGRELRAGPFLKSGAMDAEARAALARVGLDVEPRRLVATLAPGQRQLLEIARALHQDARVLIMDEPTSSLSPTEAARMFEVVRELRLRGVGIVYVSHRLAEVAALADRVVALRDGRNAGELAGKDATHDRMVALMVGRQLRSDRRTPHAPGDVVLAVRGLRTRAHPGCAIDFELRRGEVVGVAGLLGSGRTELVRALFLADAPAAGSVVCGSTLLRGSGPGDAVRAGIVLVPEDRQHQGLVLGMAVRENLSLPTLHRQGRWVDRAFERALTETSIRNLAIATPHGEQPVQALSGGNQQKVVLGKWLASAPRVLLLDEPTRGVDVAARAEIYARLHELAGRGLAVLFVSSDLEEVLALADRVLVMHQGRIAGELPRERLTEAAIVGLATGGSAEMVAG